VDEAEEDFFATALKGCGISRRERTGAAAALGAAALGGRRVGGASVVLSTLTATNPGACCPERTWRRVRAVGAVKEEPKTPRGSWTEKGSGDEEEEEREEGIGEGDCGTAAAAGRSGLGRDDAMGGRDASLERPGEAAAEAAPAAGLALALGGEGDRARSEKCTELRVLDSSSLAIGDTCEGTCLGAGATGRPNAREKLEGP
jgi:hypothetical protein